MKKLCFLMGLILLLFCACGTKSQNSRTPDAETSETESEAVSEAVLSDSRADRDQTDNYSAAPENGILSKWEATLPKSSDQEAAVTMEAIRGLRIRVDGVNKLEIAYDPRTGKDSFDYWNLSEPYASSAVVDTEALYELFTEVTALIGALTPAEEEETAGYEQLTEEVSVYIALLEGQKPGEKGAPTPDSGLFLEAVGKNSDNNYLVRINGEEKSYRLSGSNLEALLAVNPYDYILKLPYLVSRDTVESVVIEYDGKTYEMGRAKQRYNLGTEEVEEKRYNEVYTQLMSVMIHGEIDPAKTEAQRKKEPFLSLMYRRNIPEAPDYQVIWREYDETQMSVEVNGSLFFLADKKEVEGLRDFLEETLN